jgi:hypothetical protein
MDTCGLDFLDSTGVVPLFESMVDPGDDIESLEFL